jgi:mannitol-1-phosphate 5-dehydrogenase
MARALIIGAGAIGRGYLPWNFKNMEFDFYDESIELCNGITKQVGYSSFMAIDGKLEERRFCPGEITSNLSKLNLKRYDVAFVSVGPRNCSNLPAELSKLECPIFSVENDPLTLEIISNLTGSKSVFFGVPDVITSSTASRENLDRDQFALHTEEGVLYLERNSSIPENLFGHLPKVIWSSREEMTREWDAKLFLHNTPHCIAAYLGYLNKKVFLHEGFNNAFIVKVVEGVIEELVLALKRTTKYDHDFLEQYADKELRRFSNLLLYDPISRVAREPLRKLEKGGRLVGALSLCLKSGVNPSFLNIGISAALNYKDPADGDFESMFQVEKLGVRNFLKYYLDMAPDSIESQYVTESYKDACDYWKRELVCVS